MKKKDLLVSALGLSIGLGIMYMGKANVLKKLQQNNQVRYNDKGQLVLTSIGEDNASVKQETTLFDYNNPLTHSSSGYWTSQTTGTFYLPVIKNGKETGEYVELVLGDDGSIKPTIWQSVKSGIGSLFGK